MMEHVSRLKALTVKILAGCLLVGSVVTSYLIASEWWPRERLIHRSDIRESTPEGPRVNQFADAHGTNLVVYLFTASDCGWSRLLSQGDAIRTLGDKVRAIHGASYARVSVIGVALDRDLNTGIQLLTQLGHGKISNAFDQVIVGGSWLNEQVLTLVWRDNLIPPSLPQILIVERPVSTDSYLSTYRIEVQGDRIVADLVGERQITRWMTEGYPLEKGDVNSNQHSAPSN